MEQLKVIHLFDLVFHCMMRTKQKIASDLSSFRVGLVEKNRTVWSDELNIVEPCTRLVEPNRRIRVV